MWHVVNISPLCVQIFTLKQQKKQHNRIFNVPKVWKQVFFSPHTLFGSMSPPRQHFPECFGSRDRAHWGVVQAHSGEFFQRRLSVLLHFSSPLSAGSPPVRSKSSTWQRPLSGKSPGAPERLQATAGDTGTHLDRSDTRKCVSYSRKSRKPELPPATRRCLILYKRYFLLAK